MVESYYMLRSTDCSLDDCVADQRLGKIVATAAALLQALIVVPLPQAVALSVALLDYSYSINIPLIFLLRIATYIPSNSQ